MKWILRIVLASSIVMMGFTTSSHIDHNNNDFSYSDDYQDYGYTPVVMSLNNFNTLGKSFYKGNYGPNLCDAIWDITVTWNFTGPSISCTTGGIYSCKDDDCKEVGGGDDTKDKDKEQGDPGFQE